MNRNRLFAVVLSSGFSVGLASAETVNWNTDPVEGFTSLRHGRPAVEEPMSRLAGAGIPRPPLPRCALGYSHQSHGYGIGSGFTGRVERPTVNDEVCFNLGYQEGLEIRNSFGSSMGCEAGFQDAFRQALRGEILVIGSAPSQCYHAGYSYGRAYLSVNARDGRSDRVGPACVSAYRRGFQDGKTPYGGTPPNDHQERACYLSGLDDALSS